MTHEYDIAQTLDAIWQKSSTRTWIPGRLGVDSGADEDIDVVGRPGYVVVSMGADGDAGITIAKDKVGAARTNFQAVKMRRELGELVIREASAYAGGSGGGGGSDTLAGLSDVQLTSPVSGNALQYNGTKWINVVPAGGSGGAPSPHDFNSTHHSGTLQWNKINFGGSSIADLADHSHGSLTGITADQHHMRQHDIITGDVSGLVHTVVGVANQIVGLTAVNTLGLLTPSASPGASEKLLKTDADGSLALDAPLFVVNGTANTVTVDTSLFVANATLDTVSVAAPLFVVDAAADIVRMDNTLLVVDAATDKVSVNNPLFVVDVPGNKVSVYDPFFVVQPGIEKISIAVDFLVADVGLNYISVGDNKFYVNTNTGLALFSTDFVEISPQMQRIMLDVDLLYADTANNWIGINRSPSGAALDVVSPDPETITQRLKQIENQTQRIWRVEDYEGHELIVLDSVGNLQSGRPGYVSGMTGWQISPGGNAEFNNIWARGELHASVFVKDEVHAVGGTLYVSTVGKLHADANIDAATQDIEPLLVQSAALGWVPGQPGVPLQITSTSLSFDGTELELQSLSNRIEIDDPPSGPGTYFQPGEILRVKTEINEEGNPLKLSDLWLEVMSATQGTEGFSTYSVTKRSGSDCTIPAGTAIVSYGQRGDGKILMTSDWRTDDGYSPYIDVFTTGDNPWDADDPQAIIPRVRMGQLKGVGVPGVSGISQWGILAGSDLTDANTSYMIASNLGIRMYKVPLTFNNGVSNTGSWDANGNIRIGKNVANDATTGFRIITTSEIAGEEGNVIIGDIASGNYLRWDQTGSILTVAGSLLVEDPGTTVTLEDMTNADNQVRLDAQGYANTARDLGINYNKDRRIMKVSGSWNSTAANVISWGTSSGLPSPVNVVLHLANNTQRTVNPGTTGVMGARTYIYVKWVAGTGALAPILVAHTVNVTDPDYILLAVCDPGTPLASVSVVAGSTYISGGNIFTQSIMATNISSDAIETRHLKSDQILAEHIVSDQIYIRHFAPETDTLISTGNTTAQTNAEIYSNRRRVVGVGGSPGVEPHPTVNSNLVKWSNLTVRFASGNTTAVTSSTGTAAHATLKSYFYIDIATGVPPASVAMQPMTTDLSVLGSNDILLFVVDPMVNTAAPTYGSGFPTITIVAGGTYISGDSIISNSIIGQNIKTDAVIARHIQADEITGDKLTVDAITAREIDTNAVTAAKILAGNVTAAKISIDGNVDIKTTGAIRGNAKAYGSATAGFFMGYHTDTYKFDIGNGTNYLRWDGDSLRLAMETPLTLKAYSDPVVLRFEDFSWSGILEYNVHAIGELEFSHDFYAHGLVATDTFVRIETARNITSSTVPGNKGDIGWYHDGGLTVYLYLCIATNTWKRIQIPWSTW